MNLANTDLRLFCRGNGVAMHQIAAYLGISEPTLTRRWRKELSAVEKKKYRDVVLKIRGGEQDV